MKLRFLALLQCIILFAYAGPFAARGQEPTSPVGLAIGSIFSPVRAPENKTMGLTQRSFLDLLETSRQQLEIALVIDGTDSMRDSLAGIRETLGSMLDDLRLYKGADVRLQIVVYRDTGSKLGEVSFPLTVAGRRFTADQEALQQAVSSIEADSGAPYFPELIDMGIQAAITDLEWSDDPATTKWLLVFGDAPPYASGFEEAETGARRRVATEQLVTQASSKQIKINCVLCTSRAEDRPAYEAVLDELRTFMGTLSAGTGGLMLDLSYPDIRRAIEEAGKKPRVAYGNVGKISEQEIRQLQDEAAQKKTLLSRARRVRIAILPHLPLNKMSFNTDLPEVQLATDLRQRLRSIPGVQIESSGVVRRQLDALASQGIPPAAMLTTLAAMLKVDYVIWGQFAKEQDLVLVESAIYDGIGGQPLVQNSVRTGNPASGDTSNELVRGLVNKAARARPDERLTTALAVLRASPSVSTELLTRVSNRPEVEGPLLSGYESLEQAMSYRSGAAEADSYLDRAEAALTAAVGPAGDSQNGFGHMLLANCYFNQAMALTNRGDQAAATEKMDLFRSAMNQAYQFRARVPHDSDRVEIEGDFALFIRKDTAAAIKAYESIANPTPVDTQESLIRSHTALRARWMLAGIYAGDWGVETTWVNSQKARDLLLQILAYWPESSEANFIRTQLRWNEKSGQTEFTHFPHQHESVTQVLGRPE